MCLVWCYVLMTSRRCYLQVAANAECFRYSSAMLFRKQMQGRLTLYTILAIESQAMLLHRREADT